MSTRSILIVASCVLAFLPICWFLLKISGADAHLLDGFWGDFKWVALLAVVLIGVAAWINYYLTKKRK